VRNRKEGKKFAAGEFLWKKRVGKLLGEGGARGLVGEQSGR